MHDLSFAFVYMVPFRCLMRFFVFIVGTAFLLIILYIGFKIGWQKFRKRWCYRIPKAERKTSDSSPTGDAENELMNLADKPVTIPSINMSSHSKSANQSPLSVKGKPCLSPLWLSFHTYKYSWAAIKMDLLLWITQIFIINLFPPT